MQMEADIKKQVGERPVKEIQKLILDGCKSPSITGLSEEFTGLQTLNLVSVGLSTLDGLPLLENLRTIDLSDNNGLGDEAIAILASKCPRLYHILLCGSAIKTVDGLKPLVELKELRALDLLDSPISETPDYPQKIFSLIPQLEFVDGFDINGDPEDGTDDDDEEVDDEDGEHEDLGDVGSGSDSLSDEDDEDGELDEEDFAELDEEGDSDSLESGEEGEKDVTGLAYLNSTAVQDEDESEDYIAGENSAADAGVYAEKVTRGLKRKQNDGKDEEEATPTKKQAAEGLGNGSG